jgi:hypothetical protein
MHLHEREVVAVADLACGFEGLGGALRIEQPGAAESLVEPNGIDRAMLFPARLEIPSALVQGAVLLRREVFYHPHIQAVFLHESQRFREAGNVVLPPLEEASLDEAQRVRRISVRARYRSGTDTKLAAAGGTASLVT